MLLVLLGEMLGMECGLVLVRLRRMGGTTRCWHVLLWTTAEMRTRRHAVAVLAAVLRRHAMRRRRRCAARLTRGPAPIAATASWNMLPLRAVRGRVARDWRRRRVHDDRSTRHVRASTGYTSGP